MVELNNGVKSIVPTGKGSSTTKSKNKSATNFFFNQSEN